MQHNVTYGYNMETISFTHILFLVKIKSWHFKLVQEKIIDVSCAFMKRRQFHFFLCLALYYSAHPASNPRLKFSAKNYSARERKKNWKVSISFLFLYFFVVQHLNWGVLWSNNKINLIYSQFARLIVASDDGESTHKTPFAKGNYWKNF
jgi:hypothetical protein